MKNKLKSCLVILAGSLSLSCSVYAQIGTIKIQPTLKAKTVTKISVPTQPTKVKIATENGHLILNLVENTTAKNDIKETVKPSNAAMCLGKTEVRGMKVETEQKVTTLESGADLLPGMVVSAEKLFTSGRFIPFNDKKRKPLNLLTSSNAVKVNSKAVSPEPLGLSTPLNNAAAFLSKASNMNSTTPPILGQIIKSSESRSNDKSFLQMGISAYYCGIAASNEFSYRSDKYRYTYMFESEQKMISIKATPTASPSDLFTDNTPMNKDLLYINEVTYGRKIYVMLHSEMDLSTWSHKFQGSWDWAAVGAEANSDARGESFKSKISIEIIAFGGSVLGTSNDPAKVEQIVNGFLTAKFNNVVPLSYKATFLNGNPASLAAEAFLDEDNCLKTDKIKVQISSIKLISSDDPGDGGEGEELFGGVNIYMRNEQNKLLSPDFVTVSPEIQGVPSMPTSFMNFAKKESPISFRVEQAESFDINQQAYYRVLTIKNLDYKIKLSPYITDYDTHSGNDPYTTNEVFNKTIRQMLLEGSLGAKFIFRFDGAKAEMMITISPQYPSN